MIKTKKQMYVMIGAFLLVIMLGTVTYAFFNYTRTGTANVIRTGKISFNSTQGQAINLTNMFPIDASNGVPNDSTKVGSVTINVTGDTIYSEGVEYEVSAVDVSNTVGNKRLPISIDVSVASNTTNDPATTLGTVDVDYFTNRGGNSSIYKILAKDTINNDNQLVVGYIAPGAEGVDGNIVIKAYLDKDKILISDTFDGNETDNMGTPNSMAQGKTVFTTEEWNSLQTNGVSFKVKVEANEGIWVEEPPTLYKQIKENVITPGTPINFYSSASANNGQGLYILPGTENNTNPIYFYRGNINNNNVTFGDYCWQIVRTTDTGGIKMIYNGVAKKSVTLITEAISDTDITYFNDSTYPYSYDSTTKKWTSTNHTDSKTGTLLFAVNVAGEYAINYDISSEKNFDKAKFYKNNTLLKQDSGTNSSTVELGQLTTSDLIKVEYTKDSVSSSGNDNVIFEIAQVTDHIESENLQCNNTAAADRIISSSGFNLNYNSMSDVGYMSNVRYAANYSEWTTNALFATSATWNVDHYELTNATVTTPDTTHHYSCNETSASATCTDLRYVYYVGGSYFYVTLINGELIEDAIYKMTGNIVNQNVDVVTRNQGYVLNQNDSAIKTVIENWFRTNLTNEVDSTKINYVNYLEDTIYCNDRSFKTETGATSYATYLETGWNPNGGNAIKTLYFGTWNRLNNDWYSTTNVPSLTCPNETDRFSVSSSVAHLNYPVGLLTADEGVLAGIGGNNQDNDSYYLKTGSSFWTMTPNFFENAGASGLAINSSLSYWSMNGSNGVRPVVSLKPGIEFETGGDGTPANPYAVKYE